MMTKCCGQILKDGNSLNISPFLTAQYCLNTCLVIGIIIFDRSDVQLVDINSVIKVNTTV